MRPSLALSIGCIFSVLFGLPLLLAPAQTLSAFGLATQSEALIPARELGVLLTGVGIIDWLSRDALDAPLRGLLWGNIFIWAGLMVVNAWELVTGQIPTTVFGGLVVPVGFGIDIALIAMFVLALRRARD